METTLYTFAIAIFMILVWIIVFVVLLFRKLWKTIAILIAAGIIGGIAGYFFPSIDSNIMVARALNMEVMIELSIAEVHMVIGIAIGLLFGVFSILAESIRKRYAYLHDMPDSAR